MASEFDILAEIVSNIPTIKREGGKEYKTVFQYGTHADMLRYLRSKRKDGASPYYPLVWLETPTDTVHDFRMNEIDGEFNIIIATKSDNIKSNLQRNNTTLKNTLNPVYDYLVKALKSSRATKLIGDTVGKSVFFNYDSDAEKGSTDIWDAIKFTPNIKFKLNCKVKKVFY